MRQKLYVNDIGLDTFGVYISGSGTFSSPARAYDMQSVPGRNGDLVGSEKRFENIEVTYPAFMYANFRDNMRRLRNFLLQEDGYMAIRDTYHPLEYRKGVFAGPLEPEMLPTNRAGEFDLVFNCKPQRFLNSGDLVITLEGDGVVTNEGNFPSQPLLRVYGTGTVGIGDNAVTITEAIGEYTDIDCEMMDAFYGAINCNRYIRMQNNDFPTLPVGNVNISLDGVTKVEITPRWWIV